MPVIDAGDAGPYFYVPAVSPEVPFASRVSCLFYSSSWPWKINLLPVPVRPICSRRAACLTRGLLLLLLLIQSARGQKFREDHHAVVKGLKGDAIPWAKGRQTDPGVGKHWRRCHLRYVKEVKVCMDYCAFDATSNQGHWLLSLSVLQRPRRFKARCFRDESSMQSKFAY
jgi:hypothetical protein